MQYNRVPTNQSSDDVAAVFISSSTSQLLNEKLVPETDLGISSYGLPRVAAPITSTHNIRLRMNPTSKLYAAPGEKTNVSVI